MRSALLLATYAGGLGWVGSWWLARSHWPARAPRAALRLWHALAAGVLGALCWALLFLAHDVVEHAFAWVLRADKSRLHAAYAESSEVSTYWNISVVVLLGGLCGLAVISTRRILKMRRTAGQHLLLPSTTTYVAVAGHRQEVEVVRSAVPTAYCLAGRRRGDRIRITTASLTILSEPQLEAVIAHEVAHVRRRDHTMTLLADIVTTALWWTGLLRRYATSVSRLVELDADDAAARTCGARTVAEALFRMCSRPGTAGGDTAAVKSLMGGDPALRIHRLLATRPDPRRRRALATVTAALVAGAPILTPAIPASMLAETAVVVSSHDVSGNGYVHH